MMMMKSCLAIASLLASATAFAPASNSVRTSVAVSLFGNELGAQAPLNYFDPLGICKNADQARFDSLRETEIKHGRASMLAVVGYLTTAAGVRLPGMESMKGGFECLDLKDVPFEVRGTLPLTLGCIGFMEMFMRDFTGTGEFPGDYRNAGTNDYGWNRFDDATKLKKRAIELNNGRAAMMGILGIMVHEQMGNLDAIGLPSP